MLFKKFTEMVGNTPIVGLNNNFGLKGVNFFIKLEGCNPTGSVKDRAALAILQDKIKRKELTENVTAIDASSGSYACSIACLGKHLKVPIKVITGSKLTEEKESFIKFFDAELIHHGNFTIEGNKLCRKIAEEDQKNLCFLDQLHNPLNPKTHFKTTAPEIFRDLPNVKAIAFSLGSGGTLCGIGRYIRTFNHKTKLIAVTAKSGTKIPGTGAFVDGDYKTPFILEAEKENYFDLITQISEKEAQTRTKNLLEESFYTGIQTGGVLQGLITSIKELNIKGDVLIISGDAGWKNMHKLMAC